MFNDVNGNAIRDIDLSTGEFVEPGLEGWTIFLDTNNNGVADGTELTTVTDASGSYIFNSLVAGDYEVTEVLPDGWNPSETTDSRQTVAVSGGEIATASDFASFTVLNGSVVGSIWNDVNRNGARDFDPISGAPLDPPLTGWSVFLDLNRNKALDAGEPQTVTDADGHYEFLNLQVGDYEVHEIVPAGWETSIGFDDAYTVNVVSGAMTVAPDFANFDSSGSGSASIQGTVWNDLNSNGLFDASESGLSGWSLFLDTNNDGSLTAGEPQAVSGSDGSYAFNNLASGTATIIVSGTAGWRATAPITNSRTVTLKGGQALTGADFGEARLLDSSIRGSVFVDKNGNSLRDSGDRGLAGVIVYIDSNNNGSLDSGEPQTLSSADLFYTPSTDEAGDYSFTHLAPGTYVVRSILPDALSATPVSETIHTVTITTAEDKTGVDTKAVYRPNEIHGVKYEDLNGNHVRDASEPGVEGATIFVDLNRNNLKDAGEPETKTASDGTYSFSGLASGAYVLREETQAGYTQTGPDTVGGILWPTGTSNPAVGNVSPDHITQSLGVGDSYRTTVSLTLPGSGGITNLVDVFLLFDDTGSFTNNSPIVRSAFPDIINQLQTSLPGLDLGFGVGRMEEYANFAWEYSTGRPFVLNQPIVAASTAGYMASIQSALDRETPGNGGDQPETDIEALYQLVTGKGFDGNNNGTVSDSGPAGLASTQINPGDSGDVPSFASFRSDVANGVLPAAGNVGGGGFRSGALPIVLLATDTGFAYQPKGETSITGLGGTSLPLSRFTETSRPETPFNSGAGIQETVTALNALGALVIGLGTNSEANLDPRQQLEALSTLTGAVNRSTSTIDNGTTDAIAPGDPLYFEIASGFASSVSAGVINAIKNAVLNVAVDIDVIASDPRVKIINHSGTAKSIAGGQTASFDIEFIGDGAPHRFDLQFVRAGTNVVLGSIPVVLGTPISGNCYEFDEIDDGEIETGDDFGSMKAAGIHPNQAPSFVLGPNVSIDEDAGAQNLTPWATSISPGPSSESGQHVDFIVTTTNASLFATLPTVSPTGSLSFTPAPDAFGSAVVSVALHDDGGTADGGSDTSSVQTFTITINSVNDAPIAQGDSASTDEDVVLSGSSVLTNDSDVDGPALSAVLVSGPAHGSLKLNTDGTYFYTPFADWNGTDGFVYKATDGSLDSTPATVTIRVAAVNDAPIAQGDSYSTVQGVTLTVAAPGLLLNDSDVDGDVITSTLVVGPSHGTLTLAANGSFNYVPAAGFAGTDSFTYTATDGLLTSGVTTVSIAVTPIAGSTKFYVVDGTSRKTFAYDASGTSTGQAALNKENQKPRGIVTSKDSTTTWVIDQDSVVYVYDRAGKLLGSWEAKGIDKPEGIATNDRDLWIVDRETGRVFVFAGAASRKSGSAIATSSFALNASNKTPMDIVTDGSHLWVVNDGATSDQVFRYGTDGKLQGSWKLDARNTTPTGLTIDPNNVNHIWVVDAGTDTVYQYDGAVGRTSGNQAAASSFALAAGDTDPQGISDPLPTPSWMNASSPDDVNDDGYVTPLDVLTIINRLNAAPEAKLPERELGLPYWDVNDDGFVTAIDALNVINRLNGGLAAQHAAGDAVMAAWFDDSNDENEDAEADDDLIEQLAASQLGKS
ncbi:MAG: SdrD B-like domain-containing protein [Pirellulales bacterium]